jgi:formyl-CoA transferase
MDRERPDNPMFNTYETSDGEWIMLVHMTPDPYWPRLCAALEEPGWAADERWTTMRGRRGDGPELAARIQERIGRRVMAHWRQVLDDHGLIWAPVSELPDVVDDPQLRHMGAFPAIEHPAGSFETVGIPFRIHDVDIDPRRRAPEVGEHTHEVLTELGWDAERIADVAASGVIG